VLNADDRAFLEAGCALIIGTVAADGMPLATRGWGLDVLDDGHVRLLVDADDEAALVNLASTRAIAITAADVRTLHSTQMKGEVVSIEDVDEAEADRARRYCEDFFVDIHETDGTSYEVLERMVPSRYRACLCQVGDWFDQTPGPGAGGRVDRVAPPGEPS
jgi:hypothetical protein